MRPPVPCSCASLADTALESAHPRRSALGHSLVAACRLLSPQGPVSAVRYAAAPVDALRRYHSTAYVSTLSKPSQATPEALEAAGLSHDCLAFPGALDYARLVAGGSLAAADALASGGTDVAIHWDGGRHHARRDAAAGFCYVQDVVLSLQRLRSRGLSRVLYVDVDVHHCDAVAEAFYSTDAVLVVSLHKRSPGFFPGGGAATETGTGRGRGHTLNLPCADGLRDELFLELFTRLAGGAASTYRPQAVVLCCGADGLAGDPLGGWCLTPAGLARAAVAASQWGAPLLVLGGGGYDPPNAARVWATVTAALAGRHMKPESPVPNHDELLAYGPSYVMWDAQHCALRPDENATRRKEMLAQCDALLQTLRAEYEDSEDGDGQHEEGDDADADAIRCEDDARI